MKELEERIRRDGTVKTGDVLKVDAFLNHQCDVRLFDHMGQEWARHFAGKTITKILTIEASGIGIACCAARHFGDVPVVFAKKAQSINSTATSTPPRVLVHQAQGVSRHRVQEIFGRRRPRAAHR